MEFNWINIRRCLMAIVAATFVTMFVDAIMQAIFFGDRVAVMGMMVFMIWGLPIIAVVAFPVIWFLWRRLNQDLFTWCGSVTGLGFLAALCVTTSRIVFDHGYAEQVATEIGGGVTGLLLNSGIILLIALPDCFVFGLAVWFVMHWTKPKSA